MDSSRDRHFAAEHDVDNSPISPSAATRTSTSILSKTQFKHEVTLQSLVKPIVCRIARAGPAEPEEDPASDYCTLK